MERAREEQREKKAREKEHRETKKEGGRESESEREREQVTVQTDMLDQPEARISLENLQTDAAVGYRQHMCVCFCLSVCLYVIPLVATHCPRQTRPADPQLFHRYICQDNWHWML